MTGKYTALVLCFVRCQKRQWTDIINAKTMAWSADVHVFQSHVHFHSYLCNYIQTFRKHKRNPYVFAR